MLVRNKGGQVGLSQLNPGLQDLPQIVVLAERPGDNKGELLSDQRWGVGSASVTRTTRFPFVSIVRESLAEIRSAIRAPVNPSCFRMSSSRAGLNQRSSVARGSTCAPTWFRTRVSLTMEYNPPVKK